MSDALKSRSRRLRALPTPLGIVCASVLLHGCSLLYDLSTSQCSVNADCSTFGEGLVCGAEHYCQIDTSGCGTHAECLDRPDNIGASACVKEQGKTRGECVTLTSPECPQLLPLAAGQAEESLRSGDPILLGAFTNVTLAARLFNYDLAATEFQSSANHGIPTRAGDIRPVLIVACNGSATDDTSGNFNESLDRSMDQLIKLHVPGVVSSLEPDDLKRVFEEKGRDAKMFFISSQESDASLNALADGGLVWQVLAGGTSLAKAYKPVVDRTLAFLTSSGALSGTARVAQVTTPDIRLLSDMSVVVQSDPLDGGIVFNGMSVLDNIRADNFRGLTTPSSTADNLADLSTQVQELLDFKPHIIISNGSNEFLTKIIPALEQQWDSAAPGQAHPFYILSPYQYNRGAIPNTVLTQYPTVQQRLIGLNAPAATNPSLYSRYVASFHTTYKDVTPYEGFENFYDSAYYLLYSAAAASPTLSDGASMALGMRDLLTGEPHDVGPTDMSLALQALARGPITLSGTMGPPNFNTTTGGRDDVGTVWCMDTTKQTQSDVLRYQASDGTMQGNFPCFADF